MRRILIEYVRKRVRVKRGGHLTHVSLDALELAVGENSESFLVLDDAIRRLSEHDEEAAEVVRRTGLAWFFALALRLDEGGDHEMTL